MKLFETGKIGCFLDVITHATEARREDEVKIVTLALRVQPFTAQMASAMADAVRPTLFRLNDGEPKDSLKRVDFALGVPRQNLTVFAAPDTAEPSIAFLQAKIAAVYARTEKGVRGYGLVVKVSFGPVGRTELEYIQDWHLGQRFVSFEEAEPALFDDADAEDDDDDAPAAPGPHAAPMFDDAGNETPAALAANRPLHSHQSRRGRKPAAVAAAAAE